MEVTEIWSRVDAFLTPFDNCSLARGGLTLNDAIELKQLIAEKTTSPYALTIADVGCWTGMSTGILAEAARGGKVYAIDWFQGSPETNLVFSGRAFNIKNIAQDNVKNLGYNNVEFLDAKSDEAASRYADNTFDVVFLDADHRYDYIKRDIQAWLPKVKSGGVLCGHDCEMLVNSLDDIHKMFKDKDIISVMHYGVGKAVAEIGGKKYRELDRFTPDETLQSALWYLQK